MGTFSYRIAVAPALGGAFEEMDALVDTGSSHTLVPASLLRQMGVAPEEYETFELADGRIVEYPVAQVRVRLDGKMRYTLCVFGAEGAQPILGAVTLEEFGLGVDPLGRRLIPVPRLLKVNKNIR